MAVGDSAIVFGAGPIGIGVWHALRGRDIDDVHVVEPSKARRLAINALGAKTLDTMIDDVATFVADHTNGAGVDAVFETARARATIESALACIRARGVVLSIAMYEKPVTAPLLSAALTESRIQGSFCYTAADFEAVIDLMARGAYDTTGWVTTIALGAAVNEGFEALQAGSATKVLVDPMRRAHDINPTEHRE
jgi:(R,R)-butanediol dehydrogenase/meso-butanediol dehydrogenase/diacetyl reductase